jgi:hypothetical protein
MPPILKRLAVAVGIFTAPVISSAADMSPM